MSLEHKAVKGGEVEVNQRRIVIGGMKVAAFVRFARLKASFSFMDFSLS